MPLFIYGVEKQSTGGGGGSNTSYNGASAHLDDPVVVIEDLYIKPQYRGCGIATELWRKVLKSSLDRGCIGCECSFISTNKEGLQFWKQKLGSKKVESTPSKQNLIVIEISRDEMKAYHDEGGRNNPS
jgi:ribosomal protein S18 acetylase RimI-like enzyme